MPKCVRGSLLLLAAFCLVACRRQPPVLPTSLQTIVEQADATTTQLQGRILLWHPFEGTEATVFNAILDEYSDLYPKVEIVREYVPREEMAERFMLQTHAGLGPDVLINWNIYALVLIEAGMLRALPAEEVEPSRYLDATIAQVRYRGKFYGLPLSTNLPVLCYNKQQVERPPKTLTDLLEAARAGHRVAVLSGFFETFWGAGNFGGQLFDSQGKVLLDRGGWAEWLEWLKTAQNEQNFILSDDREALRQAFYQGELAYSTCASYELPDIRERLGEDTLGVTLLPQHEGNPAAPALVTNTFMFSQAASANNREIALHVANFLTNPQQQLNLVLGTESQIPTSSKVKIDWRLSPIQSVLLAQAKTSVAIPLDYIQRGWRVKDYGDVLYKSVLEGEIEPSDAASELSDNVNREFGFEVEAINDGE